MSRLAGDTPERYPSDINFPYSKLAKASRSQGAKRGANGGTLVPRTQRLTTQEAADFLGVSRPTLVKLLEEGKIPYEQPGRHRRIMFTDLLAYQERLGEERRAALDRMTEDASEAGLYDGTPEDYAAALKRARRRAARHEDAP